MRIADVPVGYRFTSPTRGEGIVTKVTPRTLTVKFSFSTVKNTYLTKDCYFYASDF